VRRAIIPYAGQPPGTRGELNVFAVRADDRWATKQVLHPLGAQKPRLPDQVDFDRFVARPLPAVHRPPGVVSGNGDGFVLPERPAGCFAQNVPVPFSASRLRVQYHAGRAQNARRVLHCCKAIGEPVFAGDAVVIEEGHEFGRGEQR
jgi:hypothetical protein